VRQGRFSNSGFALAAAILLIVCASIAVLGVTTFVVQRQAHTQARHVLAKCVYSAQAGIHEALYWYRQRDLSGNGYFSLGQVNTSGGNYYTLAASAADVLMVNVFAAYIGGASNRYLYGVTMQNATNSKTITIDRMVVTWNNSRKLQNVLINGVSVFSGSVSSPADLNISNFTLNAGASTYPLTYIQFNNSMANAVMSIRFVMTDGSTRNVQAYPASQMASFSVEATGRRTDAALVRTIRADYNALTSKITGYRELNARLP
jgi:hypothetical protein